MEWYFPGKMEELPALLAHEGVLPHGGGTFLLRGGPNALVERGLAGIISLSKLPLGEVKLNGENLEIGATATFSSALAKMKELSKGTTHACILSKALGSAAATPIRNRATIGGSVAALPPWSDLIAPLSVLDAKVALFGKNSGEYKFEDFLARTKELLSGSIIEHISVPVQNLALANSYYREIRVAFDYPAFAVAINGNHVAVSGTVDRVKVFAPQELKSTELKFGRKPAGSPEYLAHVARVAVERGLAEIGGGLK